MSCGVWSRERCVRRKLVDVPLQYSSVTGWMGGEYGHATSRSGHSPLPQRNAAQTDETARHNSDTASVGGGSRDCGGGGRGTGGSRCGRSARLGGEEGVRGHKRVPQACSDRRPLAVTRADRVIVLTHTSDTSLTHSHII